jgi:hypothetical protein
MIIQGQNINLKLSEQDIHVMLLEPSYFRPEGSRTVHNCSEALRRGQLLVPEALRSEISHDAIKNRNPSRGWKNRKPVLRLSRTGNQSRGCKNWKSVLKQPRTGNCRNVVKDRISVLSRGGHRKFFFESANR